MANNNADNNVLHKTHLYLFYAYLTIIQIFSNKRPPFQYETEAICDIFGRVLIETTRVRRLRQLLQASFWQRRRRL